MDSTIIAAIISAVAALGVAIIGLDKINKSKADKKNSHFKFKGDHYLNKPILITAKDKNRRKEDCRFLLWQQCTILVWVEVSPKGEGLRDSPSHKYVLAHSTGTADEKLYHYYNQFCLRHSSNRNRWEVQYSNAIPEYPEKYLTIGDGLSAGWHQFLISWDNRKPKAIFKIDKGEGGSDLSTTYHDYWPTKVDQSVTIGAWVTDWEGHFCETRLAHVWIVPKFSDENDDEVVVAHYKLRPTI